MLEVFTKIVQGFIMSTYGLIVIKSITNYNPKILTLKNLLLITFMSVITALLNNTQYSGSYTISVFILNIIIYKIIFNITKEESLIVCGIMMFLLFIGDLVISLSLSAIFSIQDIRNNCLLYLLTTTMVCIFSTIIVKLERIVNQLKKLYMGISKNKSILTIMFLILLIIGLSSIAQNRSDMSVMNFNYITNIIIMIIFFAITYLFINSRNSYNELSANYDNLFIYIQNFEDWIEKEQLNRHEYKNQLAVIRCLTKEKKVKNKIDEILEDNINLEGDVVSKLKFLPKGGIKGLMYYKSAIAQKKKINLTVDVSLETKGLLNKLSEQDIRVLCKLIGIYFDNAIEAAAETRKKVILLEVYELSKKVVFVFSNTFKQHENFHERNQKGVSTKGEGHGNGLYFASKLLSNNEWLESKQEVIDKYYIQQLIIHKKKASN